MKYPERKSIRLREYDYRQPGGYFITICVKDRKCLFGEIDDGIMRLNITGEIVERSWLMIPKHFEYANLDVHMIMPNHVHGIIILEERAEIRDKEWAGNIEDRAQCIEPLRIAARGDNTRHNEIQRVESRRQPMAGSIGNIIRTFKASVTRTCRENGIPDFAWQRNYYEHVIRDERDLRNIREYILFNPMKWDTDSENRNDP